MTKEEALSKVKKLFEITDKNNATPNEVAVAMAMAQKLMAKFHIEQSDVTEQVSELVHEILKEDTKGVSSNKIILVARLAKHFRCEPYKTRSRLVLCGYKSDVEIAVAAIDLAYKSYKKFSTEYCNSYCKDADRSTKIAIKNKYLQGFVDGLESALEENEAQSEQYALVLQVPKEAKDEVQSKTCGRTYHSSKVMDSDMKHSLNGYRDGYNTFKSRHTMIR